MILISFGYKDVGRFGEKVGGVCSHVSSGKIGLASFTIFFDKAHRIIGTGHHVAANTYRVSWVNCDDELDLSLKEGVWKLT